MNRVISIIAAVLVMALTAQGAGWILWPNDASEPASEQLRTLLPNVWNGTYEYRRASIERKNADGWYYTDYTSPSNGYRIVSQHWEKQTNGNEVTVVQIIDAQENIQTVEDQAYSNQVVAWAESGVGTMTKLLRRRLLDLDFNPPFSFDTVRTEILGRMTTNDFTTGEQILKFDALSLFNMLEAQDLNEDDIRNVRLYLEAQGDVL